MLHILQVELPWGIAHVRVLGVSGFMGNQGFRGIRVFGESEFRGTGDLAQLLALGY